MDGSRLVLNSQFEGHTRGYVRGNMRRVDRLSEHIGLYRDKRCQSR